MTLLAFSDVLLAIVAAVCMTRLLVMQGLAVQVKWSAVSGLLVVLIASVLGALRYSGLAKLTLWHITMSNLGALTGLPLLMVAVSGARICRRTWNKDFLQGIMLWGLLLVALLVGLAGLRPLSGAVAILSLACGVMLHREHPAGSIFLILGLVVLGWIRGFDPIPIEFRLIGMHLGLAALFVVAWREIREPGRMPSALIDEAKS